MSVTVEQVNEALKGVVDPNTQKDLVASREARNPRRGPMHGGPTGRGLTGAPFRVMAFDDPSEQKVS